MYVFFEHHKDVDGTVLATDVICSSYEHGIGIAWKGIDGNLFEIMRRLLKAPSLTTRSYNDKLHIWTYLGTTGFTLLETLQETFSKLKLQLEFREVVDLETQVAAGGIAKTSQKKIDAKDFFYNSAPKSVEITKDAAKLKLEEFFGTSLKDVSYDNARRLYRRAALLNHPDRNGGDGSKMSELNMYWQVYNA